MWVQAVLRPIAMLAPDVGVVCEHVLVAEGFVHARALAKTLAAFSSFSRDMLWHQPHYRWGLRGVTHVLTTAGAPTSPARALVLSNRITSSLVGQTLAFCWLRFLPGFLHVMEHWL